MNTVWLWFTFALYELVSGQSNAAFHALGKAVSLAQGTLQVRLLSLKPWTPETGVRGRGRHSKLQLVGSSALPKAGADWLLDTHQVSSMNFSNVPRQKVLFHTKQTICSHTSMKPHNGKNQRHFVNRAFTPAICIIGVLGRGAAQSGKPAFGPIPSQARDSKLGSSIQWLLKYPQTWYQISILSPKQTRWPRFRASRYNQGVVLLK